MINKKYIFQLVFMLIIIGAKSQNYNFYYGNIHAHSSYSDGNQDSSTSLITTPLQDFNYAKQSQHIDFYGISDHNHAQAGMNSPIKFHNGISQANSANMDGSFVALYGMEWGIISGGGHVIVYGYDSLIGWEPNNYDVFVAKNDYTNLWKKINAKNGAFGYLAHPNNGDYDNLLSTTHSIFADNAIIGLPARSGPASSTNSSYSNPSGSNNITDYNNASKQGYHLGVGLDHDTHNSVFGRQSAGRLVVLAPSLTRANILDGLKRMRFYSSDDWNIKVNFNINAQPMGSIYTQSSSPTLSVNVNDPDGENTSSITVYYGVPGSGVNPTVLTSNTNSNNLTYTHAISNYSSYYYYIKIVQTDGNTIWTSPIWYTRNDSITSNAPVADFSVSSDTVCIGQEIILTDNSFNSPTSWSWSMPGAIPTTSGQQTASLTYTAFGTYQVSLVATNSSGNSVLLSKTIIVSPPSTPSITINGNTLTSSSVNNNQWYYNNIAISGATNQSYLATQTGSYYVLTQVNNQCFSKSDTISINVIGIKENNITTDLKIFPNPTSGLLTIEFDNNVNGSLYIEIANELEQTILRTSMDCFGKCKKTVDMTNYPKGVYILKIITSIGVSSSKIILK